MSLLAVFPSMVSLYTQYCKIFIYFCQNSGAFIMLNLSETLKGHSLGERLLLEEIRYICIAVSCSELFCLCSDDCIAALRRGELGTVRYVELWLKIN